MASDRETSCTRPVCNVAVAIPGIAFSVPNAAYQSFNTKVKGRLLGAREVWGKTKSNAPALSQRLSLKEASVEHVVPVAPEGENRYHETRVQEHIRKFHLTLWASVQCAKFSVRS